MAAPEFPDMQARLEAGCCPVPDCRRKVPFGRLACLAHWSDLPLPLRRLITHSWAARAADPRNRETVDEHEHWRGEAYRFWSTGSWRHPVTKRCPHCEQDLPLDRFRPDARYAAGLSSWCRACTNGALRESRAITGDAYGKARRRAMADLRQAHPAEFAALVKLHSRKGSDA